MSQSEYTNNEGARDDLSRHKNNYQGRVINLFFHPLKLSRSGDPQLQVGKKY